MSRIVITAWRLAVVLMAGVSVDSKADSWAAPQNRSYTSANGRFEFAVEIGAGFGRERKPRGILLRDSTNQKVGVWTNDLVNRISPVKAMVTDSGRYVVTFDEYHRVGERPVVVYGQQGQLISELSMDDLKLANHPKITRSVSSYWWNADAIMVFGPAASGSEPRPSLLEDSLFIRLHWGDVVEIDLASGKVRDAAWRSRLPPDQAAALKKATVAHLDATWRRLAKEYLSPSNFDPDPKHEGILGILLARQLQLREALPLLEKIAATDRYQHWAGVGHDNLRDLVRAAIAEIKERGQP